VQYLTSSNKNGKNQAKFNLILPNLESAERKGLATLIPKWGVRSPEFKPSESLNSQIEKKPSDRQSEGFSLDCCWCRGQFP